MMKLPEDFKLAAAVERKRRQEEERKCRIFNRRFLVIGVDKEALDKQVAERKEREEKEKQLDRAFEKQRVEEARYGMLLDNAMKEEKRLLDKEINVFRAVYQRKENSRDFDLTDPDHLKKALPARLQDDDPRLGISSAQKFEGEDLTSQERAKYLNGQIQKWLGQQVKEREAAEKEREGAEKAYGESVLAQDHRAVQLDCMEQDLKKKIDEATARFNKALEEETKTRELLEKTRQNEMDKSEIYNALTGDMLTENPEVHKSAYGSNRVIGFMYKGMTEQERMDVRKYQQHQVEMKVAQKELDRTRERAFDQQANTMALYSALGEHEARQKQREIDENIAQQNQRLSQQQKSDQRYLEKVVYTNQPTAAYYQQFNTSTR